MATRTALALAFLLVAIGASIGVIAARAVPRAAVPAVATASASAVPAPSDAPAPDPQTLVFGQPLSAGCATDDAVWIVSDGGGVARYANDSWVLVDGTLRTLVSAACGKTELLAVGPGGRLLVADERTRTISSDMLGIEDLLSVTALPDGSALASGTRGTVLRRAQGWGPFARGIEEDLAGISFAGADSAWAVGSEGVAYRLEPVGWRALPTGVSATLRAVVAVAPNDAVAVGDGGALLRWRGSWTRLQSGVSAPLRGVARSGDAAYAVGDGGLALRLDLGSDRVERIDLGTACPVRGVFMRGSEAWFVASEGGRAAVWRQTGAGLQRWGRC